MDREKFIFFIVFSNILTGYIHLLLTKKIKIIQTIMRLGLCFYGRNFSLSSFIVVSSADLSKNFGSFSAQGSI